MSLVAFHDALLPVVVNVDENLPALTTDFQIWFRGGQIIPTPSGKMISPSKLLFYENICSFEPYIKQTVVSSDIEDFGWKENTQIMARQVPVCNAEVGSPFRACGDCAISAVRSCW